MSCCVYGARTRGCLLEAIGSAVQRVKPGDHVLASFTSCGYCPNCQAGHPAYCFSFLPLNLLGGIRADGSHTIEQNGTPLNAHFFGQSSLARHALIDERSLVKVNSDAPLEKLAPLGCGIQTGAGAVLNMLRPEPGSSLAVFGIGGVGLAAIIGATLSAAGRRPTASGGFLIWRVHKGRPEEIHLYLLNSIDHSVTWKIPRLRPLFRCFRQIFRIIPAVAALCPY